MPALTALTSGQLAALEMPATVEFNLAYEKMAASADLWYKRFAREVTDEQKNIRVYIESNNLSFNYGLVGDAPTFRNMFWRQFTVDVVQWWLDGVEIHETEMGNPNWDRMVMEKIGSFGGMAAYLSHNKFVDMLKFGDTSAEYLTYDGAQLFSNAHTLGDGASYDNLYAGLTLSGANLQTIKTAILQAPLGPGGVPLPALPGSKFFLIVPPALEATARMILYNTVLPENSPINSAATTATENPYRGMMELIVEPTLTDANDYYVIMTDGGSIGQPVMELHQVGKEGADRLFTPNLQDPQFFLDGYLRWGWKTYRQYAVPRFERMAKATN